MVCTLGCSNIPSYICLTIFSVRGTLATKFKGQELISLIKSNFGKRYYFTTVK